MKAPKVEVIRFNGFDVMALNSNCNNYCEPVECSPVCPSYTPCPAHNNCNGYCGVVSGYCTECIEDCIGID